MLLKCDVSKFNKLFHVKDYVALLESSYSLSYFYYSKYSFWFDRVFKFELVWISNTFKLVSGKTKHLLLLFQKEHTCTLKLYILNRELPRIQGAVTIGLTFRKL